MKALARTLAFAVLLLSFAAPALADSAPSARSVREFAQAMLHETVPDADGPGMAVLVARGDELLYRGARGQASIELGVPLRTEHVFRIGSVTKQFAAAGLLKLVEQDKLSLDDPLSKFLPDYPNGAAISMRQLLNHTSGIQSYTSIPGYMDEDIRQDLDTSALVAVFKDLPAQFQPGAEWAYNNSGYVLVGAVIEKVSGQPWASYLDQALFAPLTLKHTRSGATRSLVPGQAAGYSGDADAIAPASTLSMTQPHAAGALLSTVDDLWRWNRALHGGQVLTADSHRRMVTPEGKAGEDGNRYGYGILAGSVRGNTAYQHGGGIHGFASHLIYLPDTQISVVVLSNSNGEVGAAVGLVARKLAAFAMNDPYPSTRPIELPEAELKALVGVYRKDAETTRALRVKGGRLTSQRTGGPPFNLVPVGDDRFVFEGDLSYLEIQRNDAGKITGLRFFPGGEGEGEIWTLTDEAAAD